MTDHVARLYAVALALVVFFGTWAMIAARPWAHEAAASDDPRLAKLERREERLRRQSVRVQRIVNRRFATYRRELRARRAEIAAVEAANASVAASAVSSVSSVSSASSGGSAPAAPAAAPSVGVVSLPPVTATRSS
jgi:cell division septation protein DedD